MSDANLILMDAHPTRSDAVKNRALLLQTAQALFSARGVNDVTMTDIAEAARVGKGTLYRHFESKTVLCQALLDEDQRDLQDRALAYMRQSVDPLDKLYWFIGETLSFVQRNQPLLCVSSSPTGSLGQPAHWWWHQTLRGLIGQVNPPGDLDYIADTLYVMLDVHTVYFLMEMRGYTIERIAQGVQSAAARLLLAYQPGK